MSSENDGQQILLLQEPVSASSDCDFSENKVILDLDRNNSAPVYSQHSQNTAFEYYIRDPQLNCSFQVNIPHTVATWPTVLDHETTPPRYVAQYPYIQEVNISREENPEWKERAMQMEKGIDFCSQ